MKKDVANIQKVSYVNEVYNLRHQHNLDGILNNWFDELLTTQKIEAYCKLRYYQLEHNKAMEAIFSTIK